MKEGDKFLWQLRNTVKLSRTLDHTETTYFCWWYDFVQTLDCASMDGVDHLLPECFQITPDVRGN